MNTPNVRMFVLVCILFAGLVGWTSRWTVFEAEDLRDNSLNRRELLEEQRIKRGPIRARDGTVLAGSEARPGGTYRRRYPLGNVFSHPVGYSYLSVGRSAIEQAKNDELVGQDDDLTNVVDQLAGKEPAGDELITTLDVNAQRVALDALGDNRGAVVAIEPQTGEIRVMASKPTFDPNELNDARDTKALSNGSALNRTTQGQYPPGSTFKVLTAVAAIDSGRYEKDSRVSGKSPKQISGAPLNNFGNKDWGTIPLTTALTNSVNTVWGEVAEKLGKETMQRYMERFGFLKRVEVDLPAEERASSGVRVPNRKRFVEPTSDLVDIGRVAIGQGGLLATPLQMAMVASAVANEGTLMKPTLTDRVRDIDGRTKDDGDPEELEEVMKPETARDVGDMMASVVREGTGTAAALDGIAIAGKTGTAEIDVARNINQPWFIGFAPRDNPKIAIAVTIERSQGQGGTVAAPIAKKVLQELLK
ncbi:MAG: Cell division protein FtsI [Peptidoglycan synthetase] [uncultured Solirubrobacteraceae bacterium]|uniref:Cell division protein FtsI [Peptidoglycan synthetase] n=1 Tax=uncultured Solirubrobacteraceae bacterium TaxID=1162706 RepID=A0A6J4SA71_9ACTN|nr:MAG: Cell division protein FtsI [Peptidoglycan synthetase] [uncultured Solirubrobacteraceae bacterium]